MGLINIFLLRGSYATRGLVLLDHGSMKAGCEGTFMKDGERVSQEHKAIAVWNVRNCDGA